MATLVFTAVGQALGGPFGAALGSILGRSIDEQLFGPGPRQGPRLNDLSVQTSSYGTMIPRIYGRMRVAGSVIWATDLKEEETEEATGKGSPGSVGFKYSASFAVALSSRPILSVGRIWADGKLIRGSEGDLKVETKLRILSGGEDQAIDPLIASVETIEKTSAFKGIALAVFEDLALGEFGNRIPVLTFEIFADEADVDVGTILSDASGAIIDCADGQRVTGYAAHGRSKGDALDILIAGMGVKLVDREGRLAAVDESFVQVDEWSLGCSHEAKSHPIVERKRAPATDMPGAVSVSYYDEARDYQAGMAMAATGTAGLDEKRLELPAVLTADTAKTVAFDRLRGAWSATEQATFRLAPTFSQLMPGQILAVEGHGGWDVIRVSLDGLAVIAECQPVVDGRAMLTGDAGRANAMVDEPIGPTDLALFDVPTTIAKSQIIVAASNAGSWKPVNVNVRSGGSLLAAATVRRRAILGRCEGTLGPASPTTIDRLNAVIVQLTNPNQFLVSADRSSLMEGCNLAVIGNEIVQFANAEDLADGRFRLSELLRGRRGTEYAIRTHSAGERFCLLDPACLSVIDLPQAYVGSELVASAHGVVDGDGQSITANWKGDGLRPPGPCQLRARISDTSLDLSWVARSAALFDWSENDPPINQIYRVTVSRGPILRSWMTSVQHHAVDLADLPAGDGPLSVAVESSEGGFWSLPNSIQVEA